MIKLFIFESVDDARAFEQPVEPVRVETKPPPQVTDTPDPEADKPAEDEPEERPRKKYTARKPANTRKKSAAGDYTPEEVVALAKRIAKGEIKAKQAAKELGLTISGWYQAKARHAGDIKKGGATSAKPETKAESGDDEEAAPAPSEKPTLSCHICEEDHMTRDCPQFGAKVAEMRADDMDSLQIAAKLKIRFKDIPVE